MATVIRNSIPVVNAAFFSLFLSTSRLACPSYAEASWAVISRIMAVTASQRPTLQKSSGICIFHSSSRRNVVLVVPSRFCSSLSMITGFPATFARAQAMALERGQPTFSCVLGSFLVCSHRSLKM